MARLIQGGIYDDIIDTSMAAFILELIVKHGDPAKVNQRKHYTVDISILGFFLELIINHGDPPKVNQIHYYRYLDGSILCFFCFFVALGLFNFMYSVFPLGVLYPEHMQLAFDICLCHHCF